MSELQKIFEFEGKAVKTIIDENGNPWFVAKDICERFGDSHYLRSIGKLAEDEKGMTHLDTAGGKQSVTIVNESGLYSLLFQMQPQKGTNSETAIKRVERLKAFRKWVTSEVLPSIRKTGSYEIQPAYTLPKTFSEALHMLADSVELVETQKKALELAAPKVAFADAVNDSSNSMDLGVFAKILGTGRTRFFEWLREQVGGKPQGGNVAGTVTSPYMTQRYFSDTYSLYW